MMKVALAVVAFLLLYAHNDAFAFHIGALPTIGNRCRSGYLLPRAHTAQDGDATVDSTLLQDLRAMTTRQLKAELSLLMISTADVFEKEQLVQRLYNAKKSSKATTTTTASSTQSTTSSSSPNTSSSSTKDVVVAPLFLTSSDGLRLAMINGAEFRIETNEQQFATIQIDVCPDGKKSFPLSLLLDTACSGVVLRPAAARDLPLLSNSVTMTGAGGVASSPDLTQIQSFRLGGATFGPLPAAVQNIDVLPSKLDGILGLSFLSQFACVEMDFRQGQLRLYKKDRPPPQVPDDLHVVADADMELMGSLGIYAVNVRLGSRGPVKLLVDTGAAGSLLNWKGLSDLSLTRNSPQVKALSTSSSAMGSDNVAMQLTHRICVSSSLNFMGRNGNTTPYSGLPLDKARLCIDIGDIAVLNLMKKEEVGGILGIDALARCAMVRMSFGGRAPRITLFNPVQSVSHHVGKSFEVQDCWLEQLTPQKMSHAHEWLAREMCKHEVNPLLLDFMNTATNYGDHTAAIGGTMVGRPNQSNATVINIV